MLKIMQDAVHGMIFLLLKLHWGNFHLTDYMYMLSTVTTLNVNAHNTIKSMIWDFLFENTCILCLMFLFSGLCFMKSLVRRTYGSTCIMTVHVLHLLGSVLTLLHSDWPRIFAVLSGK